MSSQVSKKNRFSRRLEAAYRKGFEDGQCIGPDDATDEMVAAALKVDWSNENEEGTVHNVWHAMRAAYLASKMTPASGAKSAPESTGGEHHAE